MPSTPSSPWGGYPPSPWSLRGQLFLSLWRVRHRLVGTALVDYQRGSELTYAELLRATPTRVGRRLAVTITDIWVDSPASRDGGRALWAIPKDLAEFTLKHGPVFVGEARGEHGSLASAEFVAGRGLPGRLPFRSRTAQRRSDGDGDGDDSGETVLAPMSGTARIRHARARWHFPTDGPFADLHGRRPLASVVLEDFALRFGE
jgi:Acetoacetate decarboxylase (ADC)